MAAGCALTWRGGSPACVWAANDGPLQAGKKVTACPSDTVRALLHNSTSREHHSFLISDKQVAKCYRACK